MAENLGIRILGGLNEKETIAQIKKDLKGIEPQLQKLGLSIDTSEITKQVKKVAQDVNNDLQKAVEVDVKDIKQRFNEISEAVNKYEKEFNSTTVGITKNIDKQNGEVKSLLLTLQDAEGKIRKLHLDPRYDEGGNFVFRSDGIYKEISKANEQREKALKYEVDTRMAIQKAQQEEKERTEELEHQLKIYKQQAQINAQNLRRQYGNTIGADGQKNLDNYLKTVNGLTTATPNLRRQMDSLGMEFKEISSEVKTAQSRVMSFGEQFKIALSRVKR